MKLTVFQSHKGDCLLLEGSDSFRMLADGGMVGSFRDHTIPALADLHEASEDLDLVYLSHIDEDHISGVLELMNVLVDWEVFDFQHDDQNNTDFREPRVRRPPKPRAIWHNAFHEQVDANRGDVADLLAASAAGFGAAAALDPRLAWVAGEYQNLANSQKQAIELSRRVSDNQLDIPLNTADQRRLMMVRNPGDSIDLGSMEATVIGPFKKDLEDLRAEWDEWLEKNLSTLARVQQDARRDEELLGNNELERIFGALVRTGQALATSGDGELGDRDSVTTPNLASLMLLVEEGHQSILLTGDGAGQDVVKGLAHHGKLTARGDIHVDILKVQHHGSEFNMDADFARAVTADHYVFCGNGSDENPDPRVVDLVIDSRVGKASVRSDHPDAENDFTLWFNSGPEVAGTDSRSKHMRKLRTKVRRRARRRNPPLFQAHFLTGSSFEIQL